MCTWPSHTRCTCTTVLCVCISGVRAVREEGWLVLHPLCWITATILLDPLCLALLLEPVPLFILPGKHTLFDSFELHEQVESISERTLSGIGPFSTGVSNRTLRETQRAKWWLAYVYKAHDCPQAKQTVVSCASSLPFSGIGDGSVLYRHLFWEGCWANTSSETLWRIHDVSDWKEKNDSSKCKIWKNRMKCKIEADEKFARLERNVGWKETCDLKIEIDVRFRQVQDLNDWEKCRNERMMRQNVI